MTLKKLVLITAGAMLLSGTAMAKNINVPGDFAKIADALGNADAGDTILVKRGVYNENITLIMGVVLKGEDPLSTIIDGGRRGPTVMGTSGAEMSHFTVRNGLEGILCENAAPYIHHCYVIDNHATGIGAFISLPWLRNNVVYGNRWSGILAWGAKSLDAYIEQNVVLRNGYSGLALKGPTNLVARNNIFMENHYYGVFADPAAGQTKVEYNNIYKNYYPFNQFIKVNRTNVSLDPKFINPSLGNPNFFCQTTSPMLKRGKGKLDIGLTATDVVKEEEVVEETRNPDTDGDGLAVSSPAPAQVYESSTLRGVPAWLTGLKSAAGLTVNCCTGTAAMAAERVQNFDVDVESMEGAACFSICAAFGMPCYEIRAVSNLATDRDKSTWRIPDALEKLKNIVTLEA